jgi:dihydroorotase
MSKFFAIGMTLEQVLACVTHHAADALRLPGKGRLEVGADADITLFEVSCGPTLFTDTEAGTRNGDRQLLPRRPGRRRTGSDSLREITPCLLCMRNTSSNR